MESYLKAVKLTLVFHKEVSWDYSLLFMQTVCRHVLRNVVWTCMLMTLFKFTLHPHLRAWENNFVFDFKLMCDWYTANRLSLNVKKTKMMLVGSSNKLSTFQNFNCKFKLDGQLVTRVPEFWYLGMMLDEKWNWNRTLVIYRESLFIGYQCSIVFCTFWIKTHV